MATTSESRVRVHALIAEFDRPEDILTAVKSTVAAGYSRLDAYTPYHVEGLVEALGRRRDWVAPIVLAGGLLGGTTGYLMQYYCVGVNYPLNVAGRPLNSIPSFIPITFELTILFASIAALLGVFFLCGLPRVWQPIFGVPDFVKRATKSGFFLKVEARDPRFDPEATRRFLQDLRPREIYEVEA